MVKAELLTETTEEHFHRMALCLDYGFQEKHNGHFLTIVKENNTLNGFNREWSPSKKPLPFRIKQAFLSHPLPSLVVEGELVKNVFHLFDALILGSEVLVNDTYEHREAQYHAEFSNRSKSILPVKTSRTLEDKYRLWHTIVTSHGEGLVSKNMVKEYQPGLAGYHWKLKLWKTMDVFVIGKNLEGKDSVDVGVYDDRGQVHRVSSCGLRNKFDPEPFQVLEVRFLYATQNHHIVQPKLLNIRDDKLARDCKLSQLEPYINKNWMKEIEI